MGNEGDLNIKKCHKFESMTLEEAKNQKIDIYEFREAKQKIYDIYLKCLEINQELITYFCPYCFGSKSEEIYLYRFLDDDFKNIYKDSVLNYKKKFQTEIINIVNKGIIENEIFLIEYFNKDKCEHFYHEKCKIKRNHEKCLLCEQGFTLRFLSSFFPLHNHFTIKKCINELLFYVNSNDNNFEKLYYKTLIKEIGDFLTSDKSINEELKQKYKARITLCEKLRKIGCQKLEFKVINLSCKDLNEENDMYKIEDLTVEEAKSKKIKSDYFNNIKKGIYQIYYSFMKFDEGIINILCPYCFRSEKGDINLYKFLDENFKKNYIRTMINKKKYETEIANIVNKGIIENEFLLIEYFNKNYKCEHFFHENCKNKRNHLKCFLCQQGFSLRFLSVFPTFKEEENEKFKQEMINDLFFPMNSNKYKKLQKLYLESLIKKIRDFLMKSQLINEELREKYKERITLCESFREKDPQRFKRKVLNLSKTDLSKQKKILKETPNQEEAKALAESIIETEDYDFDDSYEILAKKGLFEYYRNYFLKNLLSKRKKFDYWGVTFNCYFHTIKNIDPRYINIYCPFCFKSKNGRSILETPEPIILKGNKSIKNQIKEYKKKIFSSIKEGKIQSDFDLMKIIKKQKCLHFYHKECFEKFSLKKILHDNSFYCYLCKFSLKSINFLLFTTPDIKELRQANIAFGDMSDDFKSENFFSIYERRLIKHIRTFLIYEEYDSEIQKKFDERINLCNCFRLYSDKYSFLHIDLCEGEEYLNKKRAMLEELKKKKEEDEKEEKDEEEDVFKPRYIHTEENKHSPKKNKYVDKKTICCHFCQTCFNKCIICAAGQTCGRTYLFTHKECFPKKANADVCYICNAKRAPGHPLVYSNSQKYCRNCSREFKYRIMDCCIICRQPF